MWIGEALFKLSSGQADPFEKTCFWSCRFSDWLKWHHIQKFFTGLMHTCAKFEENLPSGCWENAGAGGPTLSPLSPKYKQVSLLGRLISWWHICKTSKTMTISCITLSSHKEGCYKSTPAGIHRAAKVLLDMVETVLCIAYWYVQMVLCH